MKYTVLLLLSLTSCVAYRNSFDSSACRGICGSVTQIEASIVETPQGPDYIGCGKVERAADRIVRPVRAIPDKWSNRRIWVAPQITKDGYYIGGHYIWGPKC